PNSCAQHYIGDIGLMGTTLADGREGYYVVVGGGSDHDKGVGRALCGPVPATDINGLVEQIIGRYLEDRQGKQTFLDFVRQVPDEKLIQLINVENLAA
ncbi:MAG: NirA family protein, partial [Pseudomonadota bacterium]